MSAPESTKIQVNFRVGETLVNVYADNDHELVAELTALEKLAPTIGAVEVALKQGLAVGIVAAPPSQLPQSAPAQALGQWQQAAQPAAVAPWDQPAPAPAWAATPQQAYAQPAPAQGGAPVCAHGPMVFRQSKPGAAKAWTAHFCPTPKGTPGQCEAIFGR